MFQVLLLSCLLLLTWLLISPISGIRITQSQCQNAAQDYVLDQTYWLNDPLFTEGLYYDNDNLRIIESTGLTQQSVVRTYKLDDEKSEAVDIKVLYKDPDEVFGEGLTRLGDRYYQLTYHNGMINIFSEKNTGADGDKFVLEKTAAIPRDDDCKVPEGWGLTSDEKYFYMSTGSSNIYRFSPDDLLAFEPLEFEKNYKTDACPAESKFKKTYNIVHPETGEPLENLNELELLGNYLYANIWDGTGEGTALIVKIKIEEESMTALKIYDFWVLRQKVCDALKERNDYTWASINEFNGIAYDTLNYNFILTGKNWPMVFRVTLDDTPL